MPPFFRSVRLLAAVVVACVILLLAAVKPGWSAEPLRDGFESFEPTWKLDLSQTAPAVPEVKQERTEAAGRNGRGELIRLESATPSLPARLVLKLPAARVLDELTAAVWLRAQNPGWTVALGVTAPNLKDPATGKPVHFVVTGEVYQDPGRWTQLKCRTTDREIRQRLLPLRAQHPDIQETGQLYVDRLYLGCIIPAGTSTVHVDDLEFGPIVPPDDASLADAGAEPEVVVPTVDFRLDRLLVDQRPMFPRIVRYHGESPELLRELGFNVVWVPDINDRRLVRRMWEHGLWVTAEPPQPRDDFGQPLEARSAGLVPFGSEVDPVLFWMLGTRISPENGATVMQWIEQLEFADRRRHRPMAADILAGEQTFSRDVDLVGISRHPLQTTMSLDEYRRWIEDRRSLARPGAFCWTWLQTEPASAVAAALKAADQPPVIEPEQLRLHAYAALVAGCRGVGFWTTGPLDGATPLDEERRWAIRLLNAELRLLEPWLATVGAIQQVPCRLPSDAPETASRNFSFGVNLPNAVEREAQLRTRAADLRQRQRRDKELSAFVLRTELGALALPMWLEHQSQFVPAHGAAAQVSFVVPGPEQAAAVVELTSCGLHGLKSERITGGLRVEMDRLDEVGFVWITSDLGLVDRVRRRISTIQAEAAEAAVKLAGLKLDRVGLVDQELQTLGPAQPDAPQKMGRAKLRLERATSALSAGDYQTAYNMARETMQLLRLLQRDHWDAAVEHFSSPVSSPYTLCYQTLPEHWRLVSRYGASRERGSRNLLPSGELEDIDTLIAEDWKHEQGAPPTMHAAAALFPTGRKRGHALRLECRPQPGTEIPAVLDEPAVTVTTPPIPARAGQILHISGWIRLTEPVAGSRDGVMVYDSLLGRSAALRIFEAEQWTRFELLRVVPSSRNVTLSISLTGMGEALVDDLQVIPYDLQPELPESPAAPEIERTSGSRLLDRFPKFPRLTPLPQK